MENHKKFGCLHFSCCQPGPKGWDLFGRGVQFGQKFLIPKHSHVGNCLKDNFVQKNDLKLLLLQNDTQRKL